MATANGSEFSEQWKRNWEDHDRIWKTLNRLASNHENLHTHLVEQKKNIDNLLDGLRKLIDRIPPENLR